MAVIREGLSGLEYFRRMIAGDFPPPPMLALLGIALVEADEGRVVFTGTVEEKHYNGMGVAHGGYAATLLDSSLGCCINTLMPPGALHDARAQSQSDAAADTPGRTAVLRGQGRASWRPHRDLRRAHRRPQRQAVRPRHHDVHHRRGAARAVGTLATDVGPPSGGP
jgi:hypothetical protein